MPAPRVVHFTTVHAPFDPRIFRKEAGSLQQAGYEVFLLARHHQREVRDGIRLVPLTPTGGRTRRGRRLRRAPLLHEAFAKAAALQADVYHFHDPELIPVAYALKRKTGASVIYDIHENYRAHGPLLGRLLRLFERWCFRWVDHVILVGEPAVLGVETGRAPTTIVSNYFKPLETRVNHIAPKRLEQEAAFRLLYTGVVGERRGLNGLLDLAAATRLSAGAWRLDLVGICFVEKERHRAEARIETEQLGAMVHRTGWAEYVDWADMEVFYQRAHVGLVLWQPHPNHVQIPTKFYEYLHYGLPILCSDLPHWRAFIEQHGCGAVVPPGDANEALRVLDHWRRHPSLYQRLSEAALRAAPHYRWEIMEARLLGLYETLLAEPARLSSPARR